MKTYWSKADIEGKPEPFCVGSDPAKVDAFIPNADPIHFRISREKAEYGPDVYKIIDEKGGGHTVIGRHILKHEEGRTISVYTAAFISNSYGNDDSVSPEKRFVLGFDPSVPDLWIVDNMGVVVEIDNVSRIIQGKRGGKRQETHGVQNITATIRPGELVGIYGPSGAGKTMLIEMILGLAKPNAGSIKISGLDPLKARSLVAYLPQHLDVPEQLTCRDPIIRSKPTTENRQDRISSTAFSSSISAKANPQHFRVPIR